MEHSSKKINRQVSSKIPIDKSSKMLFRFRGYRFFIQLRITNHEYKKSDS